MGKRRISEPLDGPACALCGCTEETPCPGGCRWASHRLVGLEMQDVCSACDEAVLALEVERTVWVDQFDRQRSGWLSRGHHPPAIFLAAVDQAARVPQYLSLRLVSRYYFVEKRRKGHLSQILHLGGTGAPGPRAVLATYIEGVRVDRRKAVDEQPGPIGLSPLERAILARLVQTEIDSEEGWDFTMPGGRQLRPTEQELEALRDRRRPPGRRRVARSSETAADTRRLP